MVNLRRPNKPTRGSGLSMKYLSLLIAATMLLVIWAYQRFFFETTSNWLLIIAIALAILAFALAITNIIKVWRKSKRYEESN